MSKASDKTWLCPLCSIDRIAYGTTCKDYPSCGNKLNVNGVWYEKNGYLDKRVSEDVTSIGIAEIANRDD